MAKVLPVFRGYAVDVRLRQFRKVGLDTGIESVAFDSEEGDRLLAEYIRSIDRETRGGRKQWQEVLRVF